MYARACCVHMHLIFTVLQSLRTPTRKHLREAPEAGVLFCPLHVLPKCQDKSRQAVCSQKVLQDVGDL